MPHSLVLNLSPTSPIPAGFTSGKSLHALFLNLVSSVDADLGDRLHDNQANKAFTLSPLQTTGRSPQPKSSPRKSQAVSTQSTSIRWQHTRPVAAGTPCWWRVSLLDDSLFAQLSQLWLNLNPERPWHLGPADLRISSILGTPQSTQPWAGYCDYAQIYERASERDRKLTFQFYTPVAFRQGKRDAFMPTPERVLGSLLRRWNHYSEQTFEKEIIDVLCESAHNVRTAVVSDPRSQYQHTGAKISHCNQFRGSVGSVTFQVFGKVDPLVIKQLNALADYALYAGVGRKTPMGMGMTQRVEKQAER